METFKIKISSLLFEIVVILLLVNIFAYVTRLSTIPLDPYIIIISLNIITVIYFGTRKYVTKVICDGSDRTLSITQFRVGKLIRQRISFDELSYTFKRVPNTSAVYWNPFGRPISWKVLRIFFNSNIIKLSQNQLGWRGTDLDKLVYWFDIYNIPRKELNDIFQDEDTFPDSYY